MLTDEDVELQAAHLTKLARAMLAVDPRLSRMYGERLRDAVNEAGGNVSSRLVCNRCSMPQLGGITATVTLAPVSGARAVQVLQGREPKRGGNVVRVKCGTCGAVGATWGKPKRARPKQQQQKQAEETEKMKKKKKKKTKKLKSLSSQVKTAPAAATTFSLDDFLKL
jgi:hypothetical protein